MPRIRPRTKPEMFKAHLRRQIMSGTYGPGKQLPTIREMVTEFGVSKATVSQAISNLQTEGLVNAEHGRGIFVSRDPGRAERLESDRLRIGLAFLDCFKSSEDGGRKATVLSWVAGVEDGLGSRDHSLSLLAYHKGSFWDEGESRLGKELVGGHIDGLIVAGPLQPAEVDALNGRGIPHVLVGNVVRGRRVATVTADSEYGHRLLLTHLKGLGHERVGLITYCYGQQSEMLAELHQGMGNELGLATSRESIIRVENAKPTPDYSAVSAFFDLDPMPTAVILGDEVITDRVIAECLKRSIAVPDGLALACVTDMGAHSHVIPTTGLDWEPLVRRTSARAADLLARMIEGNYVVADTVYEKPALVVRESTVPGAGEDASVLADAGAGEARTSASL